MNTITIDRVTDRKELQDKRSSSVLDNRNLHVKEKFSDMRSGVKENLRFSIKPFSYAQYNTDKISLHEESV